MNASWRQHARGTVNHWKKKRKYFMCRPRRHWTGCWYVRFYSRDPWPWYQAGFKFTYREEILPAFKDFIAGCEKHRRSK